MSERTEKLMAVEAILLWRNSEGVRFRFASLAELYELLFFGSVPPPGTVLH